MGYYISTMGEMLEGYRIPSPPQDLQPALNMSAVNPNGANPIRGHWEYTTELVGGGGMGVSGRSLARLAVLGLVFAGRSI